MNTKETSERLVLKNLCLSSVFAVMVGCVTFGTQAIPPELADRSDEEIAQLTVDYTDPLREVYIDGEEQVRRTLLLQPGAHTIDYQARLPTAEWAEDLASWGYPSRHGMRIVRPDERQPNRATERLWSGGQRFGDYESNSIRFCTEAGKDYVLTSRYGVWSVYTKFSDEESLDEQDASNWIDAAC